MMYHHVKQRMFSFPSNGDVVTSSKIRAIFVAYLRCYEVVTKTSYVCHVTNMFFCCLRNLWYSLPPGRNVIVGGYVSCFCGHEVQMLQDKDNWENHCLLSHMKDVSSLSTQMSWPHDKTVPIVSRQKSDLRDTAEPWGVLRSICYLEHMVRTLYLFYKRNATWLSEINVSPVLRKKSDFCHMT